MRRLIVTSRPAPPLSQAYLTKSKKGGDEESALVPVELDAEVGEVGEAAVEEA